MFVGEAPGFDEDKRGVSFVGKTGKEVNEHYLPLAGLDRESCYFTNAIRCLPDRPSGRLDMNRQADIDLLMSCAHEHLYEEIAEMQPSLIVPMGAFACYAIDPNISLDLHHGMPISTVLGVDAFPMWHPSGGIHEPKKMLYIRTDWIRLGQYLNGQLQVPEDPYLNPDYAEVEDVDEIRAIDPTRDMANDTEYSRSLGPYCLTYSQEEGTGRLIRFSRRDLIAAFQDKLDEFDANIWFHNEPYDAGVVKEGGLSYPRRLIRDTMLRTAHLANMQQGLKVLSFRELGIRMLDFEDLVKPYSTNIVLEYYLQAKLENWPKPEPKLERDDKGKWKLKQPHGMNTKLKTFFTNLAKNPKKDVFKAWENWEDSHEMIESVCGPWPGMDILHVAEADWPAVLAYACRDADATLRYKNLVSRMVEVVKTGKPQDQWRTHA